MMKIGNEVRRGVMVFFFGVGLTAIGGCETIHGSGREETEERPVETFTEVEVSAGLAAHVTLGAEQSVVITGDDNIVPSISTKVRGGVLYIEPTRDFDELVPLSIEITAPSLEAARLRAGGELFVDGLDSSSFEVGCDAGGEVVATGRVDHLFVTLSAGGEIDAVRVDAPEVTVMGEAGGDMTVTATERVDGSLKSGTRARVFGGPAVRDVATESGGEVEYVDR